MYANHTLLSLPELKILEIFLDLKRHYFAELTKVTKLTRPRTLRVLRKFVKQGILEVRKEANVKYYAFKKTSIVYTVLGMVEYNRTLLFLAKKKTLARALAMFKEKCSDYEVLLIFGSLTKGYATKSSDIDVLILKEDVTQNDVKKMEEVIDLINGRTGLKISPYLMTFEEFKKRNDLAQEAIEHHILVEGAELFFRMVLV